MLKKILLAVVALAIGFVASACQEKTGPNTVTVGTIAGPETRLMRVAKRVAKRCFGLDIKIMAFSDYNTPNAALSNGSLDANAFQHIPYLKSQIKAHGYKIVSVGKTFLYPMAIYSHSIKKLSQLKLRAKVAIPNDPSNEARALLLLQSAKLIRLRPGADINATPIDILKNPKRLQFVPLDAAELPRTLRSVAIAVINTNYAIPAGLSPSKDALYEESPHSPYTNVIVARKDDANTRKIKALVSAFQSPQVVAEAKRLFGDGAVAGFQPKACVKEGARP